MNRHQALTVFREVLGPSVCFLLCSVPSLICSAAATTMPFCFLKAFTPVDWRRCVRLARTLKARTMAYKKSQSEKNENPAMDSKLTTM